jgi:hypothetical protein
MANVLAPAAAGQQEVKLTCSLTVPENRLITKRIVLEGEASSGVTLDCANGTINPTFPSGPSVFVRSAKRADGTWTRPEAVTVKNCTIKGSVRITGMGANGEAIEVRNSSRSAGHTARAQAAAPKNITLANLKLISTGGIPLYLSPGVTEATLRDSEVSGPGDSVAIYLDAESARNTLRNNFIHVDTTSREQVAVDGSAYNKIIGNRFASLGNGGIYLYRNCGEGGTVRHQASVQNQLLANVFYYRTYSGTNPAVWLSSRNGGRRYCEDDAGFPFGSSVSNMDFARNNVVAENQIFKGDSNLTPEKMLRNDDSPNFISDNEQVVDSHPVVPGCVVAVPDGRNLYIKNGNSMVARTDELTGTRYGCRNEVVSTTTGLPTSRIDFSCSRSDSNDGCSTTAACPGSRRLVGLKATCHLESASLSATELALTMFDVLRVSSPSDVEAQGRCSVGNQMIRSGRTPLTSQLGRDRVEASCEEWDRNGGDCTIKGVALCL